MKATFANIAFVCSICLTLAANVTAQNKATLSQNQLPASAQAFIQKHFPSQKISYVLVDKDFLTTTFDVMLTNGHELEFSKNGDWKEIDTKKSAIPANIIPVTIANYLRQHIDPSLAVNHIKRNSKGYELELSNKLELEFNAKGKLIGYDN
jgi:Putative beta-lactamase-inhibitor-like, PepSY-like